MTKDDGESELGNHESIDQVGILDFAPDKTAIQDRSKGPMNPKRRSAVSILKGMIEAMIYVKLILGRTLSDAHFLRLV